MRGFAACAAARTDPPRGCVCDPCRGAHESGRAVSARVWAGAHVDVATDETADERFARYIKAREGERPERHAHEALALGEVALATHRGEADARDHAR